MEDVLKKFKDHVKKQDEFIKSNYAIIATFLIILCGYGIGRFIGQFIF